MGIINQILCTLIVSFISFVLGLSFTFPSSTMELFSSANTTLERPMTELEIALFGSLSSIGALISTPLIGIFLDVIGRKYCAITANLMSVVSWTMIATCTKVEVILAAIFISGVGGAAALIVPVFVGEICQESIRGTMTSSSMILFAVGMLMQYLIGGLLEYKIMVYVCLTLTVLGACCLVFLRETPLFLMKKGLEKEAQRSFAFYRNAAFDSKKVLQEMDTLRRAFNPVMDGEEQTLTPEEQKLRPEIATTEPEKVSVIQFLKKSSSTRRAIVVTMFLVTSSILQGLVVVQVNAASLFANAVPDWSHILCSVVLALVTIVSGVIAAYLTDITGRKPLMIYASAATGICCVLLGTQIQFDWGPKWFTALIIYLYTAVYSFGAGTVPFVFMAEVFLPEVKSLLSMLVIEWAWFCNFIILFIFNPLQNLLGLGPVFYIFAVVSILSAVFCAIYQPETRGLAVDEIQDAFLSRRHRKQNVIY